MAKLTQKDIAAKLGVSVSLVSRVLSGQGEKVGISKTKIREVLDFARANHYTPQSAALALKGKKTRTLGMVVYDFHDPFFGGLIADIQELAHKANYSLLSVGFLNRNPEPSDLAPLYKHFVDGIIILGSYGNLDWIDSLGETPVARIGQGKDPRVAFSVGVDEVDAGGQIVRHLKSLGRKNFCYVARNISMHENRRIAIERAAEKAGCKIFCPLQKTFLDDFEAGCAAAERVVSFGGADAFICSTDMAAVGVIKRLNELGKKVPQDFLVTGFDDIPSAANYIPSITSFRQPVKTFASMVMDFFSTGEKGGHFNRRGELILRESTRV